MNLSNEPTNYKTHHHNDESIAHDYITTQIVSNNYMAHDLLHQTPHHLKKLDFQQAKESGILLQVYGDPNSSIIQNSNVQPSLLTPMTTKYVEQMHMIAPNDDSDKSDCEAAELQASSKHVKRNLPHKKRIAKRIVSDNQPYTNQQEEHFGIVLPNDETNNIRFNPNYVCNLCGDIMDHQLEFYIHLKKHYEPDSQPDSVAADNPDQKSNRIVLTNMVGENLIINQNTENVSGNLIESMAEEKEDEMHNQVIDEFNEFSEPEDMMEDFRKEVEKVVETIGENDVAEAQWAVSVMNYQDDEDIDEAQEDQNVDLHMYQDMSQPTNYTTIQRTSNEAVMHQPTPAELKSFDVDHFDERDDDDIDEDYEEEESIEEEDEDDKMTLEELRKETIKEVHISIFIHH